MKRLLSNLSIVLSSFVITLVALELFLQLVNPSDARIGSIYNVLYLEPDPLIGWKHVPNFEFQLRGPTTTCVEFDVSVATNSAGFRDVDWQLEKPDDVIRIAILGDSHIQAIQVNFEETAPQVFQRALDESPLTTSKTQFEVMNFGVANFGTSQFQLTYEHYARNYQPDYVFVYIAYLHFNRTRSQIPHRGISQERLKIRPTYELLPDGELLFLPPEDFTEYQAIVNQSLLERGEDRTLEIPAPSTNILSHSRIIQLLKALRESNDSIPNVHPLQQEAAADTQFDEVPLNYEILRLLNEQVVADDAQLVLIDAFDYWETVAGPRGNGVLADQNHQLAEDLGAGYINVSPLLRAEKSYIRFPCDGHYNPLGNKVLGQAMFDWLMTNYQPN